MLYRPAFEVVIDACKGFNQQIGPAVNIADSIDASICRRRSGDGLRVCSVQRSHRLRGSIMELFRGQTKAESCELQQIESNFASQFWICDYAWQPRVVRSTI